MNQQKQEKLPIDTKLLSDAVIELNISRRNVGLYPTDHPIVEGTITRAFNYLQKLFELRSDITLGIAKDGLVVDKCALDRKNPGFMEFADSLHVKGIAAVTFSSGLTKEELIRFHELITTKEMLTGKDLAEHTKAKDIRHIILTPIDFSKFRFVEGTVKSGSTDCNIWQDYVCGLLDGRLSADEETAILSISPEDMASFMNTAITDDAEDAVYDRVITAYFKGKERAGLSRKSIDKFLSLIGALKPELQHRFILRASEHPSVDTADVEKILTKMTSETFQETAEFYTERSSAMPETLRNLIDKLTGIKADREFNFDLFERNTAVVHDIEIGENIKKFFDEEHFKTYVREDYQKELGKMLRSSPDAVLELDALREDCRDEMLDKAALGTMLELLESDFISAEDYLTLITNLSVSINIFIETGRFEEILDIYNSLISHALNRKFSHEASSMVEFYFHSEEFITKLIAALRLWGRKDRDNALRLAKALRLFIVDPLLNALAEETDASMRKFLLSILGSLGSDVNPHAIKRLNDDQWYTVRNMLYLLKECNGSSYISYVRRFVKHNNINIRIEAVKTLLHFKAPDAVQNLKVYLQSENTQLKDKAVRLAGTYRVKEVVPYLIRLLEKKDVFGTESLHKIDVVRALGEIGHRQAVKPLLKICNTKTLFYRGNLEELKVEIFRTLDRYPFDSIRPLIELGLSSKDKEIKSISKKLMEKYHNYLETRGSNSE